MVLEGACVILKGNQKNGGILKSYISYMFVHVYYQHEDWRQSCKKCDFHEETAHRILCEYDGLSCLSVSLYGKD